MDGIGVERMLQQVDRVHQLEDVEDAELSIYADDVSRWRRLPGP